MKPKTYLFILALLALLPFLAIGVLASILMEKVWSWYNFDI